MSQDERIEESLMAMMVDDSPEVRVAASAAFDAVHARRTIAALLQELRTGTVEARIRAVYSAGRIGGNEGVGLLVAALADPDAEVRAVAARELGAVPTVPVLKAIVDRLPKEKGVVLANLIESLGKSRRRELAAIIERYLSDADPEVKAKAVVAFARVGENPWDRLLSGVTESNATVRSAVASALGEWTGATPPAG